MSLRNRVVKSINEQIFCKSDYQLEEYEDDYDGFTHSTYSGLANQVIEELYSMGYDESVSDSVIDDVVFDNF